MISYSARVSKVCCIAPHVIFPAKSHQKIRGILFQNNNVFISQLESGLVDSALSALVRAQRRVYLLSVPLDLAMSLFAYVGAIASFLVIAVPIFSGYYDDLSEAELADLVSENAFVCINLVGN